MDCKNGFFCKYALGAPVVGQTNVIYSLNSTLCRLLAQDLFIVTIPTSTTSTLPPAIQLCNGTVLNVTYSLTSAAAQASGLVGGASYLARIVCVNGVPTMNILNATNPDAA